MIQKNNSESSHSPPEEKIRNGFQKIKDLTWFDTKRLLADSADYFTHGQITLTQTTDSLDYTVCLLLIRHLLAEKQPVPALRYLFIDEVQDYTPAQIQFLLCLFPMTAFTLVGSATGDLYKCHHRIRNPNVVSTTGEIPRNVPADYELSF